ncbi:MAG: transposase, partial [Phycisphaerae bacterium]
MRRPWNGRRVFSWRIPPVIRRHEISDEQWERIKNELPGKASDPGRTAKDNRSFINAVLWIARTGS